MLKSITLLISSTGASQFKPLRSFVIRNYTRSKLFAATLPHVAAVDGFTADGAARYDIGRPTYPEKAMKKIVNIIQRSCSDAELIAELGAGTGKFTIPFLDYISAQQSSHSAGRGDTIAPTRNSSLSADSSKSSNPSMTVGNYLAVEPSDGFRASLSRSLGNSTSPAVGVVSGLGESIPALDNSADAVIVAQAFHWMATEATLKEIHRVLRPGRPLVLLWNTFDYGYGWLRRIDDEILTPAYERAAVDAAGCQQETQQQGAQQGTAADGATTEVPRVPRQQTREWEICLRTPTAAQLFSPLSLWETPFEHTGGREVILDRIMSTSVIAGRSAEEQADYYQRIVQIIEKEKGLAGARESGVYSMPYMTEVAWIVSKPQV